MSGRDVIAQTTHSWRVMNFNAAEREAGAILSALDKAGYAVVPKEPTREMLAAGATSLVNDQDHKGVPQMAVSPAYGVFRAMLTAAKETT